MEILKLFQYAEKMKFSDIEKALKVRSNKLAYHLKNLTKKGVLTKENDHYKLSESSEYMVPYMSSKESFLPVVLILIGDNKKAFLHRRNKRPYKNMLSLPGGRILLGESLETASKRIMKEKFNIDIKFQKLNSISFEQTKKEGKIVHSFILFLVSATTKDKVEFSDVVKNKSKAIPSDYKLITEDFNKETKIQTIFSRTK
jgi:ADP-ribose pyrophosphatase YjhB (NUDIX family)